MDPHLQQFLLPNSATTNIDDSSVFPTCDSQSTAEEAKDKTLEGTTSGNKYPHISIIRSDDPERDIWDSERMTLGSDAPQSVSKYIPEANVLEDMNIYHAELNLATYMGSTLHQNCPYSLHASDFGSQTSISPCEAPDLRLGALLFQRPTFC